MSVSVYTKTASSLDRGMKGKRMKEAAGLLFSVKSEKLPF